MGNNFFCFLFLKWKIKFVLEARKYEEIKVVLHCYKKWSCPSDKKKGRKWYSFDELSNQKFSTSWVLGQSSGRFLFCVSDTPSKRAFCVCFSIFHWILLQYKLSRLRKPLIFIVVQTPLSSTDIHPLYPFLPPPLLLIIAIRNFFVRHTFSKINSFLNWIFFSQLKNFIWCFRQFLSYPFALSFLSLSLSLTPSSLFLCFSKHFQWKRSVFQFRFELISLSIFDKRINSFCLQPFSVKIKKLKCWVTWKNLKLFLYF